MSLGQQRCHIDVVDEYRLLVFPLVIGEGTRLVPGGTPINLQLASAETSGPAVMLVYSAVTGSNGGAADTGP